MDKALLHFILSKVLFCLMGVLTLPVWYPAIQLAQHLEGRPQQSVVAWLIRIGALAFLVGAYWLARRMSYYIAIEQDSIHSGVKSGLRDARLHLAFLPLIGRWFMRDKHNRDDDDHRPA